jgi:hypothetical protein
VKYAAKVMSSEAEASTARLKKARLFM